MSTENECNESSISSVDLINELNDTALAPNTTDNIDGLCFHDSNNEQFTRNDINEQQITKTSHSRRVHFPNDDSQLCQISYSSDPLLKRPSNRNFDVFKPFTSSLFFNSM